MHNYLLINTNSKNKNFFLPIWRQFLEFAELGPIFLINGLFPDNFMDKVDYGIPYLTAALFINNTLSLISFKQTPLYIYMNTWHYLIYYLTAMLDLCGRFFLWIYLFFKLKIGMRVHVLLCFLSVGFSL